MIRLTRLDGQPFILNAELIRYVEQRPDTFVTLTSGERIVVGESMERVVELAVDYQQRKAMLPSFLPPVDVPAAARGNEDPTLPTNEAIGLE
jgi:flagellar protein FlbD